MRIREVRQAVVPIRSSIANAYIRFDQMTVSTVCVISDVIRGGKPVTGFGFHSNGRYAQPGILRDRIIPRLLTADPASLLDEDGRIDPHRCWDAVMRGEKPGGHGDRAVAVGTLDMALWDLAAKLADEPLYALLARRDGGSTAQPSVWVYAAGGYYAPGKTDADLAEEMRGYLDQGYAAVKMKIGASSLDDDKRRIEAVLDVTGAGEALAVDANGRFDEATAIAYAEALEPYGLRWYEEPGDPLDFRLQQAVSKRCKTPIATGENIFSAPDAANLLRYAGLNPQRDVLQMDPALGYGLVEFLRILDVLRGHGWSPERVVPHGGHLFALHLAAGLGLGGNESYPGVFPPFGGFADAHPVEDGYVRVPDAPGIGVETKAELLRVFDSMI